MKFFCVLLKECYIIQKSRVNPEKIKKLLKIFLIFYVQKMGEKSPFFDFPGLLNNTKISKTKKTKKLKNKKKKTKTIKI